MPTNDQMMMSSGHIRKPLPEELPGIPRLLVALGLFLLAFAVLIATVILPAEKGIDPTGIGERLNLTRMGLLKSAMAEHDAPLKGRPQSGDSVVLELKPGEGRELKMRMSKGFEADYHWHATGGAVYHDTHGDIYADESVYVSYKVAEDTSSDEGTIKAVFAGHHGWYWKNRGDQPVTIVLEAEGQYFEMVRK